MIGIYKITNLINQNSYIGQSINIEKRWRDHKYRAFKPGEKEYDKALYRAFRKYGINNFSFEIIEECQENELNKREMYWIDYYNTYKNGYNETAGGDSPLGSFFGGEKHHNHKLTKEDVIEIRQRWAACNISTRELYYDYQDKIKKSGFKKIYTWQTWKDILPELNTPERRAWHKNNLISYSNIGDSNGNTKLKDADFLNIVERYKNGESLLNIYKDYPNTYKSYESFYVTIKKRMEKRNLL